MDDAVLRGVAGGMVGWRGALLASRASPHTGRHPRAGGEPVRRGFSIQSLASLEYWVARSGPGDDSGGMTHLRVLATHCARGLLSNFLYPRNARAQGMPAARCTRGLMRNVHRECAHEHTGQRRASDIPCAMALRLIACSPR